MFCKTRQLSMLSKIIPSLDFCSGWICPIQCCFQETTHRGWRAGDLRVSAGWHSWSPWLTCPGTARRHSPAARSLSSPSPGANVDKDHRQLNTHPQTQAQIQIQAHMGVAHMKNMTGTSLCGNIKQSFSIWLVSKHHSYLFIYYYL